MFFRFHLYFFIIISSLNASITIDSNTSKISLLPYSKMYLDTTSKETFEEVQRKTFKAVHTNEIRLGYTQSTVWIQFEITNKSAQPLERYLTINKPFLDTIVLFEKTGAKYIQTIKGIKHNYAYQQNYVLHPNFHLSFRPNETKFLYLKIISISSSNNFQLYLKDTTTLYEDEFTYQMIKTVFLGAILGLIIYNLFLFFFIKELVYLYYVLYMFFLSAYYLAYTQIINYMITISEGSYAIYLIGLANIFALMFIKTFLKVENKKHLYIIYTIIFLYLMIMLAGLSANMITKLTIINILFILYLCIDAFRKKNNQIKYIFLGWVLMITGTLMQSLKSYGLWTLIDYYPYFYESTILAEAILFSVALAARLNKTKELEESLQTNTILIKELHHRVKNNMQFIIIMYRLKLDKMMNTQLDSNLKEAEGTIQAMSKTYEILYTQNDLETIDTKAYFESLISEIKQSYGSSDIHILLNASAKITMNQSIYLGIILNELMTNAFKYAFLDGPGEIQISLQKEGAQTLFVFEDNGIGFDEQSLSEDTFGLSFIEALVTDELKGKMYINSNNGVRVRIVF